MTMIDASKKINRAIESGVTATLAPKMHRNGGWWCPGKARQISVN